MPLIAQCGITSRHFRIPARRLQRRALRPHILAGRLHRHPARTKNGSTERQKTVHETRHLYTASALKTVLFQKKYLKKQYVTHYIKYNS